MFRVRKFFVFLFPAKTTAKNSEKFRQIYRSQCYYLALRRAEPCLPIKPLPKGHDVSVSKTFGLETYHSVLHFEIHYHTLHAIHRLLIAWLPPPQNCNILIGDNLPEYSWPTYPVEIVTKVIFFCIKGSVYKKHEWCLTHLKWYIFADTNAIRIIWAFFY